MLNVGVVLVSYGMDIGKTGMGCWNGNGWEWDW